MWGQYGIERGHMVRDRLHAEPLGWRGWGNRRPDVYGRYLGEDGRMGADGMDAPRGG